MTSICAPASCVALLLLAAILILSRKAIMDLIIKANLSLHPGSRGYKLWKDLPVPITVSMYLYNCTNPDEVLNGNLPILHQVGPYVFMEYHHKTKEIWNVNGTVTYQQIRRWYFNETLTNGSLRDMVVTLNAPAVTLASMALSMSSVEKVALSIALMTMGEKMFVRKTVAQILFDGYSDPLLTASNILPKKMMPIKLDKFGYFYQRNGSDWFDGVFNIYTGQFGMNRFDRVFAWNYSTHTSFFRGLCGEVRGSAEMFPPITITPKIVELYSNDLCRPLTLTYVNHTTVGGVTGLRFVMDRSYLANATNNPDNSCYSDPSSPVLPGGVFNASTCRFGAPVFISQPYFYQADSYYNSRINLAGSADALKHETVFVIEPNSGTPMSIKARFQINMLIQPVSDINLFASLPTVFFPTLWIDNHMELPASLLSQIGILPLLSSILEILGFIFLGLGVLFSLAGIAICFVWRFRKTISKDERDLTSPIVAAVTDEEEIIPDN